VEVHGGEIPAHVDPKHLPSFRLMNTHFALSTFALATNRHLKRSGMCRYQIGAVLGLHDAARFRATGEQGDGRSQG
jgi:hypothetical protein